MEFLKKAAPWLVTALTGGVPGLATMAASEVAKALNLSSNDVDSVKTAIVGATPEQVVQLRLADQAFSAHMRELDIQEVSELERIAAGDRADARQREVKTGDSWTPRTLAALIVIGYMTVQWFLLSHIVAAEMRELVMRSLGLLDAAVTLVLGYYFGSSSGSSEKTRLLHSKE